MGRRHVLLLLAFLIVGGSVVVSVWYITRVEREQVEEFERRHSLDRVEGKTVEEIEAMLGPPSWVTQDDTGGIELIVYKELLIGGAIYCFITIEKGRATDVAFDVQ